MRSFTGPSANEEPESIIPVFKFGDIEPRNSWLWIPDSRLWRAPE